MSLWLARSLRSRRYLYVIPHYKSRPGNQTLFFPSVCGWGSPCDRVGSVVARRRAASTFVPYIDARSPADATPTPTHSVQMALEHKLPNGLLIILHLHLLNFPLHDASGYDERLFHHTRGMRDRNKAMEDITYFLVGKLEGTKERTKSVSYPRMCSAPPPRADMCWD